MSSQLLVILAVATMAILAVMRVVRVRAGRTPSPDVPGRLLLLIAFLVGPPIVAGPIATKAGTMGGFSSVPVYVLIVAGVAVIMAAIALAAQYIAPGRSRPIITLAMLGREPDPYAAPIDPPLTKRLADDVTVVDRANRVFPRGPEFPVQIARAGFREDWAALDVATRTLEGDIDADRRLGIAVASRASSTAADARSRLTTLRSLALVGGQEWVV